MKVTIDLSAVKNRSILHKLLAVHLDLPSYYGRNLDALHDCLAERFGDIEVEFLNTDLAPEDMKPYLASLKRVMDDMSRKHGSFKSFWKLAGRDPENS